MKVLRQIRESKGWTQAELSRKSGLNATTIGLIESGRLKAYQSQINKLAIALGLTEDEAQRLQAEV